MFQQITIVGNIGRDPEMRYTPSGNAVTSFSVATNRTWKNAEGTQIKETTWFRCAAWGKTAEVANQYLHKGDKVLVTGRLTPGQDGNPKVFERSDGTSGSSYEVSVESLRFLSTRQNGENAEGEHAPAAETEEIPF